MKHIKLFENFINEKRIDEYKPDNFITRKYIMEILASRRCNLLVDRYLDDMNINRNDIDYDNLNKNEHLILSLIHI